jgi:hypothetical protein
MIFVKNGKSVNSLKSSAESVYESKPLNVSNQNELSKESFCKNPCSRSVSNIGCLLDEKVFSTCQKNKSLF